MPSTFEAIEKNIEQYVDMSSGKYRIDNLVMAWEIFKLKTSPPENAYNGKHGFSSSAGWTH